MPDPRTDVSTAPVDLTSDDVRPSGYLVVTLDESDRLALQAWLKQHVDAIETEMQPSLARFEEERNQFEGTMPGADYPYEGAFRVNYPITKKKVREASNRGKQAYLDSDPIWAVDVGHDPRLLSYAQRVEQAMDDAVRQHMDAESSLAHATFEAFLHGVGCVVPGWLYQTEVHRAIETYRAFDGKTMESLKEVARFEQHYPNWAEEPEARRLHAQLIRGQDVTREFTYIAPTENHPSLTHVPIKDVRVYPSVEGFAGLRLTPAYGYVKTFTRAQLRQFADEELIDEERWEEAFPGESDADANARKEQEPREVFLGTIRYQLPGDEHLTRYQVWLERRSNVLLRLRMFPWWRQAPDLIPFYAKEEETGFFKRGLAWDLKDEHVTLNALLNMFLNGIDLVNSMRFKAKLASPAYYHILSRRWSPHLPMPYKDSTEEVESMPMETAHLATLVESIELIRRSADESTGTTALQSGRESPMDPRAPATKSLLLLQQVEPNLKESLRALSSGMQEAGKWILWLYYQGIAMDWIDELPGVPQLPHDLLPELASKLQPRALLFEFDRAGRVDRNLAVMKIVSEFFPSDLPTVARLAIGQMDSQWARNVDQLALQSPSPPRPTLATGQAVPSPSATNGRQALDGRLGELAQAQTDQGRPMA